VTQLVVGRQTFRYVTTLRRNLGPTHLLLPTAYGVKRLEPEGVNTRPVYLFTVWCLDTRSVLSEHFTFLWRRRPLGMEGSCEYSEQAIADNRGGLIFQLGV
jgi:hypothetical protein